ncbi:uncharacterized protein L3040_004747 [Drepanopeziza brunnea f. sp. 'multigermtubi']|uniref:uncharacterized protein n=1 Tax=Drepanopeziza brunnea f. sp. 'multigermtubi' TaxID=698441 RepID=UPI00238E3F70|nr:hypothetical protein L3040_004747 [Drepanopeziza brunnea f. sp. 'multigermtubi']
MTSWATSNIMSSATLIMDNIRDNCSVSGLVAGTAIAYISYSLLTALYNLTLHPLAKYPGSKLYGAFYFPAYWDIYQGHDSEIYKQQHEKYGPLVRVRPNRLSFSTAQATKDIYLTRHANNYTLAKDPDLFSEPIEGTPSTLANVDAQNHKRQRRVISHAFSTAALRDQEDIVHRYTDMLISRLHEKVTGPEKGKVEISLWFNFMAFDIIGDLAFADQSHSLETGENSSWMTALYENLSASMFLRVCRAYPLAHFVVQSIMKLSPAVASIILKVKDDSTSKMMKRFESDTDRKDFTSHFLKHNNGHMTVAELTANADFFMIAGSETTATLLSGMLYLLTQNPTAFKKLREEIDANFTSMSEMSFVKESQLPYLHACTEEALRCYPPVPLDLPRVTPPQGAVIDGIHVPGNMSVGIHHLSTFHSARNFKNPMEFHPERWLGDKEYAGDELAVLQPFSIGPRNCLGKGLAYAEVRSIMTRLLWNFDVELLPESKNWMVGQKSFGLWKKGPLWVKLSVRKDRR